MANLLTQNPIILTGTQTSYKTAVSSSLGTLFTLIIDKLVWQSPTKADDTVLIIDPNSGETLARLIAQGVGVPQTIDWSANPKVWRDFAVVQFDSGYLEIYTR